MAAKVKARLKIASSQSSQSSANNTPLNLTPATHKRNSHLFADSPLSSPMLSHLVNDDRSEKKRRLQARLSDVAQKHLSSPASESRNKSSTPTLSNWSVKQVAEHLHNCIQLSRENKINVRNAFSLHLIDSMKDMIRREKETNFQMAGSSIEAGAKIYASRVDALHIQAIQVLDQVSQIDKDGDRAGVGSQMDDDGQEQEDGQPKKKTIKKKKKIIETDLRRINISNVEQSHEIDPLLHKLSKEGDSSFGGLLLDSLRCSHDAGSLMLDMMCNTEVPEDLKLHESPIIEHDYPEPALTSQLICPTFHQYEFNKGQHPIFLALNNRDDGLRFDPDQAPSSPLNNGGDADASFGDDVGNDMQMVDEDGENISEFVDYVGQTHGTASALTSGTFNSLLSLVSGGAGDYSFFGNMKNMWAGPGYWKATKQAKPGSKRPGEESTATKAKKSASEKIQVVVDVDAEIDFHKRFKKTRAATTVTKVTIERYKKLSLNLPEDLHYASKDLLSLFSRPKVFVVIQSTNTLDHDDNINKSADYNYFNKNDVDNFCPNLSGVSGEDNDDYQMSMLSSQPAVMDFDDTLIAQPNLVERINLHYAKRPKKVDFKRLKRNMWGLLTDTANDKENVDQNIDAQKQVKTGGMSFHEMYTQLPSLCPSHESRDLSPPIAFVALLHMCNEKNLLLKAAGSFVDLQIFAGEL